jgi:hypothetical protein
LDVLSSAGFGNFARSTGFRGNFRQLSWYRSCCDS